MGKSTLSATRQVRKQDDWDDDASFSDGLQDDDFDELVAADDQDKLMAILCKELETPPSQPTASQDTIHRKILKKVLKSQRSFTLRGKSHSGSGDNNGSSTDMEESSRSIGSSLRKSFRSILSSSNRDCDASFSDRQEDDDSVEFAAKDYNDKDYDRDKFMAVLCKELEITFDDDDGY
jgi:translation initiation factor 2 beta subunit (eIF-2beta)/eIF-5